ncbi:uncharacterized protein LOC130715767 [Lotus japonicus]|uniref:uncharacterized protein LOC130715767 n=1 Tax=Lotus japonicus TaxID=34305 RepID=UPI00258F26DF|nr:uncharacterized protein LOC130715767 [Lotus japonicus]
MESESKQVHQQEMGKNLEVLDILKETLTIYVKNINFIIFTILTSLPFFCVMVYFEILLQKTVIDTPEILSLLPFYEKHVVYTYVMDTPENLSLQPPFNEKHDIYMYVSEFDSFVLQNSTDKSFSKDYLPVLIQLVLIYFVPLHVLELCSAVITTDLASKLRSDSEENNMSLKQMFQKSTDISIMKGTFITSLYMLFLSASLLMAFPWIFSNCYGLSEVFGGYIFFAIICCVAIGKLLMMYLEWSAIWNMSIVISVLDGVYGPGAFRVSYFFSRGNQKRGLLLMLVFFIFGFCLRLISLSMECYKGGIGIFLQIGVLTVVNTLKWVSCVIYFCDCKKRKMEKRVDEELGNDLESGS